MRITRASATEAAGKEIPEGMMEHTIVKTVAIVTNPHKHAVTLRTGRTIQPKEAAEMDLPELRENEPWINGQGLHIEEKVVTSTHLKPIPPEPEGEE